MYLHTMLSSLYVNNDPSKEIALQEVLNAEKNVGNEPSCISSSPWTEA